MDWFFYFLAVGVAVVGCYFQFKREDRRRGYEFYSDTSFREDDEQ